MRKRGEGGFVQAGDMPAMKALAKKYKPPTRAQLDLIDAAVTIHEQPDAAERAFMARQLVICTLPHSDPGDVPVWSRKSGPSTLSIQPGFDEDNRCIGFPYGTVPRLLLFWITREAQLTKNNPDLSLEEKRTLHLGPSLNAFMRDVGLSPNTGGGKRGAGTRLHRHMDRLFNARISFIHTAEISATVRRKSRLNMEIAPQSEFWWDVRQPEQGSLFQSWIKLGQDFYHALVEMPVPVDMRALRALKRSPLALDLYAWTCYRSFVIVQKNQPPQFVSWEQLSRQLGTDYGTTKNFKPKAQAALRKIEKLYPGLKIGTAKGGFTVHATRLAVAERSSGKVLGS